MTDAQLPWNSLLPMLALNPVTCRGILGPVVGTQGDGPFPEAEFDDFLQACQIEVRFVSSEEQPPPVLIFGRTGWEEDDVDAAWERLSGDFSRVYSQELVVASLAIGMSIFDATTEDPANLIDGHPALEYFLHGPEQSTPAVGLVESTSVKSSSVVVTFNAGNRPDPGVLRQMGYRVGRNGLSATARRLVLEEILAANLHAPSADLAWYIAEWGKPRTVMRYKKMSRTIASLARTARKRKSADMSEAVSDWESDVDWLVQTYGRA